VPVEVRDVNGGQGVVITGTGVITEADYIEAMIPHLTQDEDKFSQYRYSLSDYTGATQVDVPNHAVERVAQYCEYAARGNPLPVVATVAGSGLPFGLTRMWEILVDTLPWETMSFTDRDDAEAWLRMRVKQKFGLDDISFD